MAQAAQRRLGHDSLSGFSITVSVYRDGDTVVAVYRNASVDRSFNPTPEQINRRLAELDGAE